MGRRAGRAGTPSAWSCRSTCWARASTCTAAGQDLAFPHHENERAQAVADGKAFARHWVHNGWVEVEGTKMSKSLGNFTTLPDLLSRSDARAYRLLVLRAHYRSPIEVTPDDAGRRREGADPAGRAGPRDFGVADLLAQTDDGYRGRGHAAGHRQSTPARWRRSGRAWTTTSTRPARSAGIFELVTAAHSAADAGDEDEGGRLARTAAVLAAALGLPLRAADAEVDDGVGPAGGRARRGPRRPGTSPGPTPCATSWWPGAGPSRTPRRAPPIRR